MTTSSAGDVFSPLDILEIPQGFSYSKDPSAIAYAKLRDQCLYHYSRSEKLGSSKRASEAFAFLDTHSIEDVVAKAENGYVDALIDLGMRYYTKCGLRFVRKEMSIYCWEGILYGECSPSHRLQAPATPSQKALAFSCVTMYYYELYQISMDLIDLGKASIAGHESVRLGLTSHAVLASALAAEPLRHEGISPLLFKALDLRKKELLQRMLAGRPGSVPQTSAITLPNKSRCAEPTCPTKITPETTLRKCAGPCSEDIKPYYCGTVCQRKNWSTHKPICKGQASVSATSKTKSKGKTEEAKLQPHTLVSLDGHGWSGGLSSSAMRSKELSDFKSLSENNG